MKPTTSKAISTVLQRLMIAYSLWILLHWGMAVGFPVGAFTDWAHISHGFDGLYEFPFFHTTWLVPLITGVLVSRAILCLVTGISLLRRAPWARTLEIVTAFLALIHPFYPNLISYLYAVGTPAVCSVPGVRADSCGMTVDLAFFGAPRKDRRFLV